MRVFCYNNSMSSNVDYLEFVLELLKEVDGITYRKMMGEFILYRYGVIFGGVYDNRFLVKKTAANEFYEMSEAIPYPGGSPMLLVDSEDPDLIKEIVLNTLKHLKTR